MRASARYARLFFQRPFLGRWSSSAVEAQLGPTRMVRDRHASCPSTAPLITPTCMQYAALDAAGVGLLAAAKAPDFDSFFGGLEAAVASGGILLIALVVVVAIKKLFAGA